MRRVPICRRIAPPASPPGPLTRREIVSVLSQQRFDLVAEIRVGASEQSVPLGGVAVTRGVIQLLNLVPSLRPSGHRR